MNLRPYAALALAILTTLNAAAFFVLRRRIRRLERMVTRLQGWELREFDAVGGTGNVHRRRLGWRTRWYLWRMDMVERAGWWWRALRARWRR